MKRLLPIKLGVRGGPPRNDHCKQLSRCYVCRGVEIIQSGSCQHQTKDGKRPDCLNHRGMGHIMPFISPMSSLLLNFASLSCLW